MQHAHPPSDLWWCCLGRAKALPARRCPIATTGPRQQAPAPRACMQQQRCIVGMQRALGARAAARCRMHHQQPPAHKCMHGSALAAVAAHLACGGPRASKSGSDQLSSDSCQYSMLTRPVTGGVTTAMELGVSVTGSSVQGTPPSSTWAERRAKQQCGWPMRMCKKQPAAAACTHLVAVRVRHVKPAATLALQRDVDDAAAADASPVARQASQQRAERERGRRRGGGGGLHHRLGHAGGAGG